MSKNNWEHYHLDDDNQDSKEFNPSAYSFYEFSDEEVQRIGDTFRAWCSDEYEDADGFCKSVSREEIIKNGDSLSPGRYIGTEEVESVSDEDFKTLFETLNEELQTLNVQARTLEQTIAANAAGILGNAT